jgi:hypothetical protein
MKLPFLSHTAIELWRHNQNALNQVNEAYCFKSVKFLGAAFSRLIALQTAEKKLSFTAPNGRQSATRLT